ncbi:unnamed protein product [Hymenolepis diminuta]|uniref:Uncharacterized protein n=1 Tax=Hymenolepis diminuta TaxID=6216 RepID=A0A564Z0A4_HYMDI|nr:unnamed protein product [Hymenolepis diminuta]
MLFREFNKCDHYLCSSYFQPMDPADLTYEKVISKLGSVVGDSSSLFNLIISEDENVRHYVENQLRCLIFILGLRSPCHAVIRLRLLSLLDKKPDVKKSRRRPESAEGLLTASVQLEGT